MTAGHAAPTFREALLVWLRVAALSFGGPAGQIAVMHRILVDEKHWIDEPRFLHALNYCMLLPGPEAQQLATYIGWLLHGVKGGLAAGLLFILPGFVSILGLSILYAQFNDAPLLLGIFFGVKAAVLAVVVEALVRIARRALKSRWHYAIAAMAFLAIFALALPFPLIIAGAGLAGFALLRNHVPDAEGQVAQPSGGFARSLRVLLIWGALWLTPVAALLLILGPGNVFTQIAVFYSKMAVVTFGGAYAVLAYVGQQAVGHFGWLRPGEMLDGLGMAETTPGPLIMVLQFIAFMAGWRNAMGLNPLTAGILASVLGVWITFTPCFLWIFLGAPYVEALRHNRALNAALSGITATVVGVILNLALWFALHVLFARVGEVTAGPLRLQWPDLASVNGPAVLLSAAALVAVLRFRIGMLPVIAACGVAGVAMTQLV